ncbi:MAG TPA: hypothetical protein VIZ68_06635 [Thermoplasmata archaeon]
MKRVARTPAASLSMDSLDAAGGFGALAGALSVVLPFFDGLTMTLAALVVGTSLLRWARARSAGRTDQLDAAQFLLGLGSALAGWGVFLAAPPVFGAVRGLVLGLTVLPLWWLERRRPAFGEE